MMSPATSKSPKFSGKQKEGVFGAIGSEYEDEGDEDEDEEVSDDFMEGYDHKKNKKKTLDRKRKMDPSTTEPFPRCPISWTRTGNITNRFSMLPAKLGG